MKEIFSLVGLEGNANTNIAVVIITGKSNACFAYDITGVEDVFKTVCNKVLSLPISGERHLLNKNGNLFIFD